MEGLMSPLVVGVVCGLIAGLVFRILKKKK